jgi:hypothetical protein
MMPAPGGFDFAALASAMMCSMENITMRTPAMVGGHVFPAFGDPSVGRR